MTAKLGVIGWPVAHSRSPLIHNYWIEKHTISAVYDRAAISPEEDFATALGRLRDQGWIGANVTVPHKERALAYADTASERAQRLGAANILAFSDAGVHADNSDGYGFVAALQQNLGKRAWADEAVYILGAGGAARAILGAVIDAGAPEIFISNRNRDRAEKLAALAVGSRSVVTIIDWEARAQALPRTKLLVNTTSLGMAGQPPLALSLEGFRGVVFDIVYSPLATPLLSAARAGGLVTVDGLDMLLHQAVPAFELWFGVRPEVDAGLRALLVADIEKGT
jgi:shikimate dehydrogenase